MIRTGYGCRPFGFRNKALRTKIIALGFVYLSVGESEVGHTSTKSKKDLDGLTEVFFSEFLDPEASTLSMSRAKARPALRWKFSPELIMLTENQYIAHEKLLWIKRYYKV